MKLSIIVPVYNVGNYLQRCLESIFEQDLSLAEYEVILINDGSTDSTKEISAFFETKYSNLRVIHQENKGVSSAKNAGLAVAKGTYITFIDGDDTIYPDTLQPIVARMTEEQLDLLYLAIESYTEAGALLPYDYTVGVDGVVQDGFTHPRRTFTATVYHTKIIGATRFVTDIVVGEDTVFNALVQSGAERCSYCALPYYQYTFREDSSSKKGQSNSAYLGFLKAIHTLDAFKKEAFPNVSPRSTAYFDAVISIFILRIVELHILPGKDKRKYIALKKTLAVLELSYLQTKFASDFPFFDTSFFLFITYQKIKKVRQTFLVVAHSYKQRLFRNVVC
jgi:glycosyltransferase involved in cell wall biosynthesis